jgi:hypothetical protein
MPIHTQQQQFTMHIALITMQMRSEFTVSEFCYTVLPIVKKGLFLLIMIAKIAKKKMPINIRQAQ